MCIQFLQHWLGNNIDIVGSAYKWPLPGWLPVEGIQATSSYERNRELRLALHREFANSPAKRNAISRWYVMNWGRVVSGDARRIDCYVEEFTRGNPPSVMYGVATWSKIAALSDPHTYAIYDSRVSLALNALQAIECGKVCQKFPLAPGKARATKATAAALKQFHSVSAIHAKTRVDGYQTYLSLLKNVGDIQAAEMILFAKAPEIAVQYLQRYAHDLLTAR